MNAYEHIELFGLTMDPRAAMEPMDAETAAHAVNDAFDNLWSVMQGTMLELFDAQPILWSFVNVFHMRARKIARERLEMETRARDLIETQDGSEIASTELEDAQREMARAEERETCLEYMREAAASLYREVIGQPWTPASGSRKNPTPTASMIDARDYLRAKAAHDAERLAPKGTRVAIAGGLDFLDVAAVFTALDRARDRVGDMVLIHGGAAKGVDRMAVAWADHRNVPQIMFKPDFQKHRNAAPFKRNDAMLKEKPRAVIVFPGNGISENIAQKAEQQKIAVWRPKHAPQPQQEAQQAAKPQHQQPQTEERPAQAPQEAPQPSRTAAAAAAPSAVERSEGKASAAPRKLSDLQRADIARHVFMGGKTRARIAKMYGVSPSTVARIVNQAKETQAAAAW